MPSQTFPDIGARTRSHLPAGYRLGGKYVVLRLLGAGGMGSVYLAEDIALKRRVAVKTITPEADETTRQRFSREARIAANLRSESIVRIHDFGEDEASGAPYFVMDAHLLSKEEIGHVCLDILCCPPPIADGEPAPDGLSPLTLQDVLEGDRTLGEVPTARLGLQILDALAALHTASPPIIHRDLKPSNLLFTPLGRLLLADFGISKPARMASDSLPTLTLGGNPLGTPIYAAPEQRDGKEPTIASDYYAFGLVLYRMLSGGLPPAASTALPSDVGGRHTRAWNSLLAGLLARDPASRLTDRDAIRRALARIASGRRAAPFLIAGAALLAIAALSAALMLSHGGRMRPAEPVGGGTVPERAFSAPQTVNDGAETAFYGAKGPLRSRNRKSGDSASPPWKSMKAILDKHLPESLEEEWRRKVDGEWGERVKRLTDGNGESRDNALAKVLMAVHARFAGCDAQDDSLQHFEDRLDGNANGDGAGVWGETTREAFFRAAIRCLDKLDSIAENWAEERTVNALWDAVGDGGEFREFLCDGSCATPAQVLRLAFLTEPTEVSDKSRRLRVLLNLLDDSDDIDGRNYGKALSAGLDFLAGRLDLQGLEARQAGYSPGQLEDEKRKWPLDANRVVEFEKDDLAHCGSLRFVGWGDFADETDVAARLGKIRAAIEDDWIGFFCKILARLERGKEGELKNRMAIPHGIPRNWGRDVLSDRQVVKAIAEMEAGVPEPAWPPWLRHFQQLAREKNLWNYHGFRSFEGWVFVLSEASRSPDSIRLDYNENERTNRKLLAGEIIYYEDRERRYALRAAKRPGFGYNVWDVSWYESTNPVAKPLPTNNQIKSDVRAATP